jgi:hypothetical protein
MGRYPFGEGKPGASLVPVIWYETISQWEHRNEVPLSSLFFHKISTLTRFRLEQQGLPVPLPYAWYLFGTAAQDLPHLIQFFPDPESEQTKVEWRGPSPELFRGDRSADLIRSTIDSILDEYPPDKGELAVDEVYTHAPFEFQRKFRRVRMAAGLTGVGSAEAAGLNVAGGLWGLTLDAFDEFPYARFPTLASSVAVVREAVNVGINVNLEQRRRLAVEAIEGFWTVFCAHLRLDHEGSKDVSQETIQSWRRMAEQRDRVFVRNLGDIVVELARWEPSIENDGTLGPVAAQRRVEQVEEERLVEEGLEALSGIGAGSVKADSGG